MSDEWRSPELDQPGCRGRGGAADVTIHEHNKVSMRDSDHYQKTGHHLDEYGRRRVMHETFGCFVATAVYGSYDCPEVVKLRGFRDGFLKKHALGRAFIAAYYRFGPYLAKMVKGRPLLSVPTKATLDLFIRTFLEKKRL